MESNQITDLELEALFPGVTTGELLPPVEAQTAWDPPSGEASFDKVLHLTERTELADSWKVKWYQRLYYSLITLWRTGHWPVKVFAVPGADRVYTPEYNPKLFRHMYKDVVGDVKRYVS